MSSSPSMNSRDSRNVSLPEHTICDCQNQLARWNWNGVPHEDLPDCVNNPWEDLSKMCQYHRKMVSKCSHYLLDMSMTHTRNINIWKRSRWRHISNWVGSWVGSQMGTLWDWPISINRSWHCCSHHEVCKNEGLGQELGHYFYECQQG